MMEVDTAFPATFVKAMRHRWGDKAPLRLRGIVQSISATGNDSEIRARTLLLKMFGKRPFLNEQALNKQVFATPGPVVDFVAEESANVLILIEAKSKVESAHLKSPPIDQKFSHTFNELAKLYRAAGLSAPRLGKCLLMCDSYEVSGRSSWGQIDGKVARNGAPVSIGATGVRIDKLTF